MNQSNSHDEERSSAKESQSSSAIETDADKKKKASRRNARDADPDHKKSFRRSWRSASPLTKVTLILTGIIAIATVLYMVFAGWQLYEIHSGSEETRKLSQAARDSANTTKDQLKAMQEQSNVMQKQLGTLQDQANSMREQANTLNDSLKETRKAANAAVNQANASQTQANTSQVLAKATEESARIARQSYEAGQRPKVFFKVFHWREKPTANKRFDAQFVESNSGGTAYNVTTEISTAVVPISFKGTLPYDPVIGTADTPLEQGGDHTITTDFTLTLTEVGIKALEDEKVLLVFYGHIWWEDSLRHTDRFTFCYRYNEKAFPDLVQCPDTMKVPERPSH